MGEAICRLFIFPLFYIHILKYGDRATYGHFRQIKSGLFVQATEKETTCIRCIDTRECSLYFIIEGGKSCSIIYYFVLNNYETFRKFCIYTCRR